jgi:hypothetical protein
MKTHPLRRYASSPSALRGARTLWAGETSSTGALGGTPSLLYSWHQLRFAEMDSPGPSLVCSRAFRNRLHRAASLKKVTPQLAQKGAHRG